MNNKNSQPKVLISALDWGLGHATRIIPIIKYFKKRQWEVALASSSEAYHLLKSTFPELLIFELPSYKASYKHKFMMLNIFQQLPRMQRAIKDENQKVKEIIQEFKADLIISDNRYGVYHSDIPSVFISHQLQILPPNSLSITEPAILKLHKKMMLPFDQIWVPDFQNEVNLGGRLSHPKKIDNNTIYIGPLSRFSQENNTSIKDTPLRDINILAWISGPEPERENLEEILLNQLQSINGNHVLLKGLPSENSKTQFGNIMVYSHLHDKELLALMPNVDLIICRSGYSSIMDVFYLQKKAVFVATPRQTEQVYLAEKLLEEKKFYSQKQSEVNVQEMLNNYNKYSGFERKLPIFEEQINRAINELGVIDRRGDE